MTMNQEGYPVFKGIAETAGVYGHTRPFPYSGSGSHRRIIRRLHRFLNRLGEGCRFHSHDGHGTGGTDNHLHQAAWRTPQQKRARGIYIYRNLRERTVNHFIQYGTQKEKNFLTDSMRSWRETDGNVVLVLGRGEPSVIFEITNPVQSSLYGCAAVHAVS